MQKKIHKLYKFAVVFSAKFENKLNIRNKRNTSTIIIDM